MNAQKVLALLAQAGIAFHLSSVAVLHRLRPDLDPASHYVSEYAVGQYSGLMTAAFWALSLGSGALALALHRESKEGLRSPLGVTFLASFSAGIALVGMCRTDLPGMGRTRTGRIHDAAGLIAFRSIILAMLVLSLRFNRVARWRPLQGLGWILALLAVVSYLVLLRSRRPGWPQRTFLAIVVLWLGMVARRLYTVSTPA